MRFKFVAFVLAVVLLSGVAMPLLALCLPTDEGAEMQCPPDCPMMKANAGQAPVAGDDQLPSRNPANPSEKSASCCQARPQRALPATTEQPVSPLLQVGVLPVSLGFAVVVPAPPVRRAEAASISPPLSPQAILCTFLV